MTVLVAGAGVAGLASAVALRRAGVEVIVADKASELREIGAALSLWPNALGALGRLGLEQEVRARSVEASTAVIRSPGGRRLVSFDAVALRASLDGLPVVVLRADLQAVLLAACRRLGIEVRLAEAIRSVTIGPRGPMVRTDRSEELYAAVVGADGINSAVRSSVTDRGGRRDCHRTAWRAVVPDRTGLVGDTWLTVGTGVQFIASPAPHGLAYWAADTPRRVPAESPGSIDSHNRAVLEATFGTWHHPIPQLIDSTPPESLIVTALVDRPPPHRMARGPVVLVGDAAHAMTPDLGQGACQALEDAAALLDAASGGSDLTTAFAAFERRRLPRVRRMVRESHAVGRVATANHPVAVKARDLSLRLAPAALGRARLAAYGAREFGEAG